MRFMCKFWPGTNVELFHCFEQWSCFEHVWLHFCKEICFQFSWVYILDSVLMGHMLILFAVWRCSRCFSRLDVWCPHHQYTNTIIIHGSSTLKTTIEGHYEWTTLCSGNFRQWSMDMSKEWREFTSHVLSPEQAGPSAFGFAPLES